MPFWQPVVVPHSPAPFAQKAAKSPPPGRPGLFMKECMFDNNEDMLYIFMEYASNGDLSHLIEQAK